MPSPITGVSIALLRGNEVLLARRGRAPYRGFWSLPGGRQHMGETLEDAARRELAEETALAAKRLAFVTFHEPMRRDGNGRVESHFVLAVFACRSFAGEARAGDDAAELAWCRLDRLEAYRLTPGTAAIVRRAATLPDTQT